MKDKVVVQRELNASPRRVWSAITDKKEMKQWYFDLQEFKAERSFSFRFNGGPEEGPVYVHICEVTELVPEKRLTYSWRYEGFPGISHVTWNLQKKENNTLLTLTHTGLDTITPAGPDFAIDNFEAGWNHFVNDALPKYLENASREA